MSAWFSAAKPREEVLVEGKPTSDRVFALFPLVLESRG